MIGSLISEFSVLTFNYEKVTITSGGFLLQQKTLKQPKMTLNQLKQRNTVSKLERICESGGKVTFFIRNGSSSSFAIIVCNTNAIARAYGKKFNHFFQKKVLTMRVTPISPWPPFFSPFSLHTSWGLVIFFEMA